ncbi:amidohydrolase [Peptoniphilus catoniae]|uniref:amidohydrolase n=1 Tax=Peptoniphilus catoniae TaxID=1660341 RepID=UPI0010FD18EE|nr:amidohydrolase [Peptoniphilus catoniae]
MKKLNNKDLISLAEDIWDYAELKFEEEKSSKAQMAFLKDYGFAIEDNLAGIPTAFKAEYEYGSEGPCLAILGEFDALSGLSQVEDLTERKEKAKGACGHGCGHHLLGSGSIGAAINIRNYIEENKIKAKVIYFGCPAEEGGSAKAFMARAGAFNEADLAISWHPFNGTGVLTGSMQANKQVYVRFYGQGAHAASNPQLGRSALDALELVNVGVNFLREHIEDTDRIHYAITDSGGSSPNVVQPYAEGLYLMRSLDVKGVEKLYERFKKIVEGAGLMTETRPEIVFDKACSNIVPNRTIEEILYQALLEEGPVKYTDEDLDYAKKFRDILPEENLNAEMSLKFGNPMDKQKELNYLREHLLYDKILDYYHKETAIMGSSDVGDVSNVIPTSQIIVACFAIGTAVHSWQEVAQGKSSYAIKGMLKAVDVLTNAGKKILDNPELIKKAKEELINRRGKEFISPIPEGQLPLQVQKMKGKNK